MHKMVSVWGRSFELEVIFDCYTGEEVLLSQQEALKVFLDHLNLIEEAKAAVESYCLKRNGEEISDKRIDNIFRFVLPKSLYIQRRKDNARVVGLMCDYKFNPDDGLCVVFENEKLKEVGSQNVVL